jgi:hypothetical protein
MDGSELAEALLGYAATEGVELTDDVNQLERLLRDKALAIAAAALELRLSRRRLGYEGPGRPCACGSVQKFVGHRSKTVATLVGQVTFERAYYRCRACGESSLPYDERVGLGQSAVSEGMGKAVCLCGVQEPFAPGAEMLRELTGQKLAAATAHRVTQRVGAVAEARERELAGRMETWTAPVAEVRPDRLYVSVDGVMAPRDGEWHEAKTVTCYWDEPDGSRGARHAVRLEDAGHFVPFVWSLACRCGLEHAKEVVLIGDGARWIWDRMAPALDPTHQIVDWYHAMEHVWSCGRALHGEGTPEAVAWVKALEALLHEGDVRAILGRLGSERARCRSPGKRDALGSLMTYLKNQDDRLAYDKFRAAGLDIGSGRVESACKSLVIVRARRPGMQWKSPGLQATLSLRAVYLSKDWDTFWARHPLAAT